MMRLLAICLLAFGLALGLAIDLAIMALMAPLVLAWPDDGPLGTIGILRRVLTPRSA